MGPLSYPVSSAQYIGFIGLFDYQICCNAPLIFYCLGCLAALVFQGVGWFDVGLAVFIRRYGLLADKFVPYSARFAALTREEVIQLLKSRLQPVQRLQCSAG